MRFRKAITLAYDFALDARANMACLANAKTRKILRRFKSAEGSMQLCAVLELENCQRAFRFFVTFADDIPQIYTFAPNGRQLEATAVRISGIESIANRKCAVMSLTMPANVDSFMVGSPECGVIAVSAADIRRMVGARDAMMVNPAIDARYQHPLDFDVKKDCKAALSGSPKFSIIVPLYKTPLKFFWDMTKSVISQTYSNWELILVNVTPEDEALSKAIKKLVESDTRVREIGPFENRGISLNTRAGIDSADGDYFAFLDHDDLLEPNTLKRYAEEIARFPNTDLIYCDEDSITYDAKTCFEPRFKPAMNEALLYTHNYFVHFLCVSRTAYEKVQPYDSDVDGAQDYDLTLKICEIARDIRHIPEVLYHWRAHEGSTNGGLTQAKPYVIESSINAIGAALERRGISGSVRATDIPCVFEVEYSKSIDVDVSMLIAYSSIPELAACIASIEGQRKIIREIICVGPRLNEDDKSYLCNGSSVSPEDVLSQLAQTRVSFIETETLSYGNKMAEGISSASGAHLLLCGDFVRFSSQSDCIGHLRDVMCRNNVGIASAKCYTPEGLILHAGICVKEDRSLGYLNQGFVQNMGGGYNGCAECDCDYSAVDAICIMARKTDLTAVKDAFKDFASRLAFSASLCFSLRENDKLIVVRPNAWVEAYIEPESLALGASHVIPKSQDYELLWKNRPKSFARDILYNPNVSLEKSYFNLDPQK